MSPLIVAGGGGNAGRHLYTHQRPAVTLKAVRACRCSRTVTEPGVTRHTWPPLKTSSSHTTARLKSARRYGGLGQNRNISQKSVTLCSSQSKRPSVAALTFAPSTRTHHT